MVIRGNATTRAAMLNVQLESVKQRLYWYFCVLYLLNSITQSIAIPVIPKKKSFLLVFDTTSVSCLLHTLRRKI
jgi:hypothetical protein